MDRFFSRGRLSVLSLLLAALLVLYLLTLYKLQIVEGEAYYESSTNNIVTTKTVTAARGDILDRYGRVLVSNRTCSNIVIDTDKLFEMDDPNAVILQLIDIVESCGEEHIDTMPVTDEAPFEYVDNMTSLQSSFLSGYLEAKDLAPDTSAVELMAYCREHIAKYAMPTEIEFRAELPKTLVGKVAYRVLEEEEEARAQGEG